MRVDKWKIGLEAYYYSQQLTDGTTGRDYCLGHDREIMGELFYLL
jgi:hypothetical protein